MNKDELLRELIKLKDEDYSNDALFNDGYRTSMMDAIDLVKKLNLTRVSNKQTVFHECQCEAPDPVEIKICLECDGVTH